MWRGLSVSSSSMSKFKGNDFARQGMLGKTKTPTEAKLRETILQALDTQLFPPMANFQLERSEFSQTTNVKLSTNQKSSVKLHEVTSYCEMSDFDQQKLRGDSKNISDEISNGNLCIRE